MKIGLGLYRESLTSDNFRFARQAGATHIVAHLTNYFRGRDPSLSAGSLSEEEAGGHRHANVAAISYKQARDQPGNATSKSPENKSRLQPNEFN